MSSTPTRMRDKAIHLENPHVCEICGRARSGWKRVNHDRCSRIRQQRREEQKELPL